MFEREGVMKKVFFVLVVLCACFFMAGCATGITSNQKREYEEYRAMGLAAEEKNVALATGLGILPGGGSFYTRNYGLGVLNLLLWPYSIFWDPKSGANGATYINYYATKTQVTILKKNELRSLEEQVNDGMITITEYILEREKLRKKYSIDG
jgi:hypothetical protein